MTSQSKNNRLLPLTVIEAAAGGDVEAINAVLKHYAGYIARLSMRELYDEYGNPHLCVDEELRRRLETKLITKPVSYTHLDVYKRQRPLPWKPGRDALLGGNRK